MSSPLIDCNLESKSTVCWDCRDDQEVELGRAKSRLEKSSFVRSESNEEQPAILKLTLKVPLVWKSFPNH